MNNQEKVAAKKKALLNGVALGCGCPIIGNCATKMKRSTFITMCKRKQKLKPFSVLKKQNIRMCTICPEKDKINKGKCFSLPYLEFT